MRAIGHNIVRKEGLAKVLGQAVYTADMEIDNCLYGRTVRSAVPHGRIRQIRFKEGIPWRDFVIVLPSDIPGKNGVTLIDSAQPFLAENEIHHIGEPLALIAHTDRELLETALQCIEVDVEELPGIFTMEEALARNDVFKTYRLQRGDPDGQWREADLILEETYRTGSQEHLYIETQAVAAKAIPGEQVSVWGSMQCPYYVQKALAPLLGMPAERIRVVQMETGGGFGGKEEYPNMIAGHAALLSWKAGGRPVKMIYDRREDMLATTKRHPSKTRIKAAFRRDGTLIAMDIDLLLDGGAYPTLSSVVLSRATLHSWGPYRCDHTRVVSRVVKTNSNPYGAFRGFGAPQAIFAIEMHMNRAAHELGIDPTEIRRRNFLSQGDTMPTGQVIKEDVRLDELMDRALTKADYQSRRAAFEQFNRLEGNKRRGISLSTFFHGSGFTGSGEMRLGSRLSMRIVADGTVEVLSSNVEYGQGTNTVFSQIASEVLEIPAEWISVRRPDTSEVPNSGPTVASRTTMIVGKLVERAARALRSRMIELNCLRTPYSPDAFRNAARDCLQKYGDLTANVEYESPEGLYWDDEKYEGEAYAGYAWSCDVAEVEIDMVDYAARVTRFTSVVECGRVINPLLAAGQIEGGIAQGIGFALYENVVLERGAMKNTQYTNYIVPTAADTPVIAVDFIEFPHSNPGPFQAKGIGEMPIDGPAPAIASAISHALGGHFINEIPILPERIMQAVKEK
ncbi:MAG: xanthine dehydrogenase family protein [Acidobacteria bacterium]|nr:xanthine dehydrogenase family protein [Acidobacteriota bacterium]